MEDEEKHLKTLLATCEEFGEGVDDLQAMVETVEISLRKSNMASISIKGNADFRFTDDLVIVLVEALVRCNFALEALRLRNHRLTEGGVIQICQLILPASAEMSPLIELDLEGNDINSTGCQAMRQCLRSQSCKLELLNLSWNAIGPEGGHLLAEALPENESLQNLQLANCELNLSSLVAISTSLANNSSLTSLTLDRPILSTKQEENADHLSRVLTSHSSLREISLKHSRIGCHSCHLFSQELLFNKVLISLNLECNSIGVKGAEAIASYLMESDQLQTLRLSSNRICDDGAIAMATAIRSNKSLTELTLRHNNIDQDGLVAIGNSLYKNSTLKELSLWGNSFDDVSCSLFQDLYEGRIPYVGLSLDCQVYIVDGIHCIAEKSL